MTRPQDPKKFVKRLPGDWWQNIRLRTYVERKIKAFDAWLAKRKENR